MEALDGNAIAGSLLECFGVEMTTASGRCTNCGAVAQIAELRVYARAPGSVGRCRSCGAVLIVIVSRGEGSEVRFGSFELLGPGRPPAGDASRIVPG